MYMNRHAQCSLKDTFLCRLLLLLPCIFPCRSDSLCALRSGKLGLRRKTALTGSSAKEQNRLQSGFFFKVEVLTSLRWTIPITLAGCFLPQSYTFISNDYFMGSSLPSHFWYLLPLALFPCPQLENKNNQKSISKRCHHHTCAHVSSFPSVLTGANRNTVFLVWQQTPWKVYIHSWFVSLPLFFFFFPEPIPVRFFKSPVTFESFWVRLQRSFTWSFSSLSHRCLISTRQCLSFARILADTFAWFFPLLWPFLSLFCISLTH